MFSRLLSPGGINKAREASSTCHPSQELYSYGGDLLVTIHSARGVRAGDLNGFSDPYCILLIGGEAIGKTPVLLKTRDPDFAFQIQVPYEKLRAAADRNAWPVPLQPLVFQLWDRDYGAKDDHLGSARVWPAASGEEGGCIDSNEATIGEEDAAAASGTRGREGNGVWRKLVNMHVNGGADAAVTGSLLVSASWQFGNAPAFAAAAGGAYPAAGSAVGGGGQVSTPHRRIYLCSRFDPQRGWAHLYGGTDATLHISPPPGPETLLDMREDVSRWDDAGGSYNNSYSSSYSSYVSSSVAGYVGGSSSTSGGALAGGGGGGGGGGSSGSLASNGGGLSGAGSSGSGGGPLAVEGTLVLTELRLLFLPYCDAAAAPPYLEHHTVQVLLSAVKTLSHRPIGSGARLLTVLVRDGRALHFMVPAADRSGGSGVYDGSGSKSGFGGHAEWAAGLCTRGVSAERWCERVSEEMQWRRAGNSFVERWAAVCDNLGVPAAPAAAGGSGSGSGSGSSSTSSSSGGIIVASPAASSTFCRKFLTSRYRQRPKWSGVQSSTGSFSVRTRYDAAIELARLGVGTPGSRWRISNVNAKYLLAPTYPKLLAFPAVFSDAHVLLATKHRSKQRLPALTWLHQETGAPLVRSAQPMTGISQRVLAEDVMLLTSIREAAPLTKRLCIVDARPLLNARANQINGKGFEDVEDFGGKAFVQLHFMDIDNIHVMRDSLAVLMAGCHSRGPDFHAVLGSSGWMRHISQILRGAQFVAERLQHGWAVLVHCSDGWDRTAQITSLAQLLLDPYYRTMEGFEVLVEKEWCSFGHMFEWRCLTDGAESSPVFLQFLDASWQLLNQFPDAFEFSPRYLLCLAEAAYGGIFGTFSGNCERDRAESQGLNAFEYISRFCGARPGQSHRNPLYQRAGETALRPCCDAQGLELWQELYLRGSVILLHRARQPPRAHCLQQRVERQLSAAAVRSLTTTGAAAAMAVAAAMVLLLALAVNAMGVLGDICLRCWSKL